MKQFFFTHIRSVVWTIIILIACGLAWYIFSNREPALGVYVVSRGNITASIDIPGTVSSSNSVDLSFQESGKISVVYVQEGESVTAGQALASLDDSTQQAQLSQEEAALAIQTANLASLEEGTRPEQLAVTQAQVTSDQTALTQANESVENAIQSAYTISNDAIYNKVNQFINIPQSIIPSLTFSTSNSQLQETFISEYVSFLGKLAAWQSDVASLSSSSSNLSAAETEAQTNLGLLTQLLSDANTLLNDAPSSISSISNWITNISTARTNVNVAVTTLTGGITGQQNSAATLNKDQKNLLLEEASSTPETIDAQEAAIAQVQAEIADAQLAINNATIVAPFSGIARNVTAQLGMVVSPNTPVLSIINNGILKVDAYASETDVPKIESNATSTVTLDAYGAGVKFLAKVTAIDTSETTFNGSPAYHVTLYFTNTDSRIRAGMTGDVDIISAEHDNVVEIPSQLVLDDNGNNFALLQNNGKNIRQQITLGLFGDDGMVEVISGLHAGEKIIDF